MEEWVGAGPCGRSRHAGCLVGCRGCLVGALAHPAPTDCSQGLSCQRGARSVFPSGCSQLLLLSPGSLEGSQARPGMSQALSRVGAGRFLPVRGNLRSSLEPPSAPQSG